MNDVDSAVLKALQAIAAEGGEVRQVNGKRVQWAGAQQGLCVYARIEVHLADQLPILSPELVNADFHTQLRELMKVTTRLIDHNLLYRDGSIQNSFWVVMD